MKYRFSISSKPLIVGVLISLMFILSTCDRIFEYSPYEANVKKKHYNTTTKNLQLIEQIDQTADKFKFAFVTDTHFWFTNLKKVVDDINARDNLSFVIFGGDIADQGLLKDYELFYKIVEKLNVPYLTVIGNHDYLSNGGVIYQRMFGDYNYSFEFNECKFILFDNIVWESNKTPNFDWLLKQLIASKAFSQRFVIAHIPPFSDQLNIDMEHTYQSLMAENDVSMSINGHIHSYTYKKEYDDAVYYLTGPSLKKPSYCIIEVENKSFDIDLIELQN